MDFLREIGVDRMIEVLTVILSLCYVGLIACHRRAGWWFGIVASLLSVWLFIRVNLFAESLLYVYYVVMGLYGYFYWKYGSTRHPAPPIITRSLLFHGIVVTVSLLLTVGLAEVLLIIGSSNVYADAATTIFSFVATWMVARRMLENWIYWIAIDAFSVWLYSVRGLQLLAGQMALFSVVAAFGFFLWLREYRLQTTVAPSRG